MEGMRRQNKRTRLLLETGCVGGGGGRGVDGDGGVEADRLSDLPDELLYSVISSLPTKEAVRTGALSRRWRYLPSLIPVSDHLIVGIPFPEFPVKRQHGWTWDFEVVDRAISAQPGIIRACDIVPEAMPPAPVLTRWADALACRGVRELVLDFRRDLGADAWPVLLHCKALTRLELYACNLAPDKERMMAPSPSPYSAVGCVGLSQLKLEDVQLCDDALLGITSACQRLERLEILSCYGFKWFVLGEAQSLKSLSFRFPMETHLDDVEVIDVDAPNLESLDLRMLPPPNGLRVDAPKLRSVHLCLPRVRRRCFEAVAPGLRRLLDDAPSMTCLQLRGATVDCLSIDQLPDSFHSPFTMLKKLYVNVALKYERQALCLAVLLQQFTRLEQLNLFIIKGEIPSAGASPLAPEFHEHQWRLEDAGCLRDHLRVVTISGFTGEIYETSLVGFILMEARVLKKLTLSLSSKCPKSGETTAHNLSTLKRASCKANFAVKRTR